MIALASRPPQAILTVHWTSLGQIRSWWAAIQSRTITTAAWPCSAAPLAPPPHPCPPWTKEASTAGSPAVLAARASTATRTLTSGKREASKRLLDVRLPLSGPSIRGHGERSSRSWTRSWRKPRVPCCTSPAYAAAQRAPNILSRAQNLTGNEVVFFPIRLRTLWTLTSDPRSCFPVCLLLLIWSFIGHFKRFFLFRDVPVQQKQMAIVSLTQENKAI